jgi:phospholipid/cholesterol/gamma-HCH transport system substrate-binding protein
MRLRGAVIGLVAVALTTTGCGSFTGVYDLPLPGGADIGDHPFTVKAQFRDVLDLVPQSGVKVNEVAVGRVSKIDLAPDGWTAEVTLAVNGNVRLPANALAKVRQSSLLGEKYIELTPPPSGQEEGSLADGALIPLGRTNRNTEVEEVLGALSMLLNGGGVDQLQTITEELNTAVTGNEPQIKALLTNVDKMVTTLDARKSDITRALDGMSRLSITLAGQKDQIGHVIDNIGPGLRVLSEQRQQLVTMLQSLDNLSGVATDTVNKSKADLVADLQALTPALRKLAEAGANLPKALEILLSFPFTDGAVPTIRGDYANLYADIELNLEELAKNFGRSRQNPLQDVPFLGDLLSGYEGQPGSSPLPLPQSGTRSGGGLAGILGALLGGGG